MNTATTTDARGLTCSSYDEIYLSSPSDAAQMCGNFDDNDFTSDACCVCNPQPPPIEISTLYVEGNGDKEWMLLDIGDLKQTEGTLFKDTYGEDGFHEVTFKSFCNTLKNASVQSQEGRNRQIYYHTESH